MWISSSVREVLRTDARRERAWRPTLRPGSAGFQARLRGREALLGFFRRPGACVAAKSARRMRHGRVNLNPPRALSVQARDIGAPAAELRNVARADDALRLDDEAFGRRAVGEPRRAEPERGGDAGEEVAQGFG